MVPPPGPPAAPAATVSSRLAGLLLLALTVVTLLLAVAAVGWWRATRAETAVEDLDESTRRELVEELLRQSPGVFQWAWYAPEIGYTLRPDSELTAWGSTFRSNSLGYRTGALDKPQGVFRIVFVGDSWTFGMGVEREQSYPEVAVRLANQRGAAEATGAQRVEAWTLALPGYNTFNAVGAFWYHLHALQPDAVVVGISANDNHSTHSILPNGSSTKAAPVADLFGDRHPVIYGARHIDSFRYAERWRIAFGLLRDLEQRVAALEIPLVHLFVGRTRPIDMHSRVEEAGLEAPFAIVPLELTKGRWSNRRWGHGTPEANEIYGAYVYALLAHELGWPALEEAPRGYRRFAGPVEPAAAGVDARSWGEAYREVARASAVELFPDEFRPGADARLQTLGDFAPALGLLGRAATVLVRRRGPDDSVVRIEVRAIERAPGLYPLELRAAIPSPGDPRGERTVQATVTEGFAGVLEVPIPPDLDHSVLDVQLDASRVGGSLALGRTGSVLIERISFGAG